MSGGHAELKLKGGDAYKLLVCNSQLGTSMVDFQSQQYVYSRRPDGVHLIDLGKTWEKLMFAARAIAAVENPADVCVVSARPFAQRALLKFAVHTGATAIVGRFVPGSFTNQIQKRNFKEPRLIVVSDPRVDQQAINEASYVNIPVIAFTNSDSPLKHVDIAIPGNNKAGPLSFLLVTRLFVRLQGTESVGLMWWFLAREILRLRSRATINENEAFFMLDGNKIMPDLYFYRDPEDEKKREEVAAVEEEKPAPAEEWGATPFDGQPEPAEFQPQLISDWAAASEDVGQAAAQPPAQQPAPFVQPAAQQTAAPVDDDGW
ncbi:40S ribosomal protein SA [Aphelenchoides fujianensis]|nr:40S ribosomal protein SA [Aphelenchoides fujianensis]